jgi:hypothetical protein
MGDAQTNSALLAARPVEYVDDGATALTVRRVGQGPAVILLPGFPLHSLTYRRLVPHWQMRSPVIVSTFPGPASRVGPRRPISRFRRTRDR